MTTSLAQGLIADVLSIIFTDIGVSYHLCMLKVSAVCRHWYNVALSTPQAWSRISMDSSLRLEYLEMYLARSGSASLHVYVREGITDAYWALLLEHKDRIRCLTVIACYRVLRSSSFPMLEKLRLYACRSPYLGESRDDILSPFNGANPLDISRFPNLRYVDMAKIPDTLLDTIEAYKDLPRLQRLSTTLKRYNRGLRVVMNAAETLVSLTLTIGSTHLVNVHLPLPHLRHFGLYSLFSAKGTIEITAPQIESVQYLVECGPAVQLRGDALNVKYLFTNSIRELRRYPNVQTLWIFLASGDFWSNLSGVAAQQEIREALAGKILLCPKVEKIIALDPFATYKRPEWLRSALETNFSLGITRQSRSCIPGFMPKELTELCECYCNKWIGL